ncbi:Uncharacterised protein [Mycobacteroides abscessus subsp. massiliense]|nr:Uncharacterised protein [Mycobacteroides abscessus subsp. massiliense]
MPQAFAGGVVVVVIPRKEPSALGIHQLADRISGVGQYAVRVEARHRAFVQRVRVVYRNAGQTLADGSCRRSLLPGNDHRVLGRTKPVVHCDIESPCEFGDIRFGSFVSECHPQWIGGVVRVFCGRQHVGQRLAHVVHVRGADLADVGQKSRCGEFRRSKRGSCGDGDGPSRQHGIRMEQRHRHITDVGGRQREALHQ